MYFKGPEEKNVKILTYFNTTTLRKERMPAP
jgi:hypothetical protein